MITKTGMQAEFAPAVKDLVELDLDAIEAYDAAIERLESGLYKTQLSAFREDHRHHVQELGAILEAHGEPAPDSPSMAKQWLTKGKVMIGGMIGDKAILGAMLSNEVDTNTAYERMTSRDDIWADALDALQRGLADERRHKAWFEAATSE